MRRSMIIIVTVILALSMLFTGCGKKAGEETVNVPVILEDETMRDTILYYSDDNGYSVPVMRKIPWEEGIGKAALKNLVAGTDEDIKLNTMGIKPPVPKDVTFDLDIKDGVAKVDIQLNGAQLKSKRAERAMLACVVNTLMEFPTVEEVKVTIDGKEIEVMSNGMEIAPVYLELFSNVEPIGAPSDEPERFARLYFISASNELLVPTARLIGEEVTAAQVMEALQAPESDVTLQSPIPPLVEVLGVEVMEGKAIVNLSAEFLSISDIPNSERLSVEAITKSLTALDGVESVEIRVEGKLYEPSLQIMAEDSFYNVYE